MFLIVVVGWFVFTRVRNGATSTSHSSFSSFLVLILLSIPRDDQWLWHQQHRPAWTYSQWLVVGGSGVSPYLVFVAIIGSKCWTLSFITLCFWSSYPHSHIIIIGKERQASFLPTVSKMVLNMSAKVNLPSLTNQFNSPVFAGRANHPSQLPERSKMILETNPITKITKKYPRTKPKASGQTSSSDTMTQTGQQEPGTPSQGHRRLLVLICLVYLPSNHYSIHLWCAYVIPGRETPSTIHGLQRCWRWHRRYSRTSTEIIIPHRRRAVVRWKELGRHLQFSHCPKAWSCRICNLQTHLQVSTKRQLYQPEDINCHIPW